jgi:hypothetical protein
MPLNLFLCICNIAVLWGTAGFPPYRLKSYLIWSVQFPFWLIMRLLTTILIGRYLPVYFFFWLLWHFRSGCIDISSLFSSAMIHCLLIQSDSISLPQGYFIGWSWQLGVLLSLSLFKDDVKSGIDWNCQTCNSMKKLILDVLVEYCFPL